MRKEINFSENIWFYLFACLSIVCGILAFSDISKEAVLLPIILLFVLWAIVDYKQVYNCFYVVLPFSIEIYLSNGLGTDLPSEPYMVFLMFLFLFLLLWKGKTLDKSLFSHPITLALGFHILWILFSAIMSTHKVVSIKFLLAKLWYVLPFYFLTLIIVKSNIDIKKPMKLLVGATFLSVIYVMIRHAFLGFGFAEINEACKPIYRNHVSYAAILVMTLPYLWALFRSSKIKWPYILMIFFWFIAIYLTYTRAAYGIVVLSIAMFWVIRFRLVPLATLISIVGILLMVGYYTSNNRYLELAPEYERTVMHTKFDNLLEATYKLEDISTMERLHRWVAGFHMIDENPIFGYGPGTFYNEYPRYTVNSFQTYVSDNPEKSGVHNYYLMTLIEQGFIGLFLLIGIILIPIFYAQHLFFKLKNEESRIWMMACLLSFFSACVLITINDMLEADKVGPLFFFAMAIITITDLKSKGVIENENL